MSRFSPPIALLAALATLATAGAARAEDPRSAADDRWHLVVDGDLFTLFSLRGDPDYSLHMAVRAPEAREWVFGLGFFGGLYPGFYRSILDWSNGADNEGWDVRVDGILLRAFYFLDEARRHFFVGAHIGVLRWETRHDATGSLDRFNQAVLWPAIGYRWFPGGEGLFFAFWAGAGILSPGFGGRREGAQRYEELRVLPFAAVHLGVEI